jgi:hypothetical protein
MATVADIRLEGCVPCTTRHRSPSFCFPVTMSPRRGYLCSAIESAVMTSRTNSPAPGERRSRGVAGGVHTHTKKGCEAVVSHSEVASELSNSLTVCALQHTSTARAGFNTAPNMLLPMLSSNREFSLLKKCVGRIPSRRFMTRVQTWRRTNPPTFLCTDIAPMKQQTTIRNTELAVTTHLSCVFPFLVAVNCSLALLRQSTQPIAHRSNHTHALHAYREPFVPRQQRLILLQERLQHSPHCGRRMHALVHSASALWA